MTHELPEMEDDARRVKEAAAKLGEYFDTVQIFCTRHEPADLDGTGCWQYGVGNWYARYGHIVTWMDGQNERSRIPVRDEGKL